MQEIHGEKAAMKCDFCSATDPTWRYPAKTFETAVGAGNISIADWAACNICKALIDDTNLRGLLERSLDLMIANHPEMRLVASELYGNIATLVQEFVRHRTGPATPIQRTTKNDVAR